MLLFYIGEEILRHFSADLTNAISNSFDRVATELCAKHLIPQGTKDDLLATMGIPPYNKACQMMTVMQSNLKISSDPQQYLRDVCAVLMSINDNRNLTELASEILVTLNNSKSWHNLHIRLTT